jgi:hypothetical protein
MARSGIRISRPAFFENDDHRSAVLSGFSLGPMTPAIEGKANCMLVLFNAGQGPMTQDAAYLQSLFLHYNRIDGQRPYSKNEIRLIAYIDFPTARCYE